MGDMFQKKTEEIFNGVPNGFSIADDILIAHFDKHGRDHDATLDKVLRICRKVNLKLHKDKCLFICTSIPFLSEVIFWQGVSPDPRKIQALMDMPPLTSKKELQSSLSTINYLSFYQQLQRCVNPCKN